MGSPVVFPGLLMGILGVLTTQDLPGATPRTPAWKAEDVRDVVFLANKRPILIRLHLRIDGQPYRQAHQAAQQDYVKHLFEYLDADGSGDLTEREVRRMPPTPPLQGLVGVNSPVYVAFNFRVLDENDDGKVSAAELLRELQSQGPGPFQDEHFQSTPFASALGSWVALHLNPNMDGTLTLRELKRAPRRLLRLDRNGNGVLTPREIVPAGVNPTALAGGGVSVPMSFSGNSALSVYLPVSQEDSYLSQALISRYGGPGEERSLSRARLGLDRLVFARLDTNKDKGLDAEELAQFTHRPADLEITLHLGKRRGALIDRIVPVNLPKGMKVVGPKGSTSVLLVVGNEHLRLRCVPDSPRLSSDAVRGYLQRFRAALRGKKYLTKRGAFRAEFFPDQFALLDRDGDGKMTAKELRMYLGKVHRRLARLMSCITVCHVAQGGSGLFDLLDRDRDGQLGQREIQASARLVPELANLGGANPKALALEKIPRTHHVILGLGQVNLRRASGFTPPGLPMLTLTWDRPGLIWFTRMDRNRDGDLSPAEFLGTRDQFRRLDTDRDGLVSRQEASQFQDKKGKE